MVQWHEHTSCASFAQFADADSFLLQLLKVGLEAATLSSEMIDLLFTARDAASGMDYFKKAMEPVSQPETHSIYGRKCLSSHRVRYTILPRCLGDSGLPKSKISDVVLVGGSTRVSDLDASDLCFDDL